MIINFKSLLLLSVLTGAGSIAAVAQEIPSQFQIPDQPLVSSEISSAGDSVIAPPKRRLMPENLSIMERGVWGENGIFRSIGLVAPLTPDERKY